MDYTICPSENNEYIVLSVHGAVERSVAMRLNFEVTAMGNALGTNRYLFDFVEARNIDSPIDQYGYAYADMSQATTLDRGAFVAVLIAVDDHSHDFVETVLRNAGFQVKLFVDRQVAVDYLLNADANLRQK